MGINTRSRKPIWTTKLEVNQVLSAYAQGLLKKVDIQVVEAVCVQGLWRRGEIARACGIDDAEIRRSLNRLRGLATEETTMNKTKTDTTQDHVFLGVPSHSRQIDLGAATGAAFTAPVSVTWGLKVNSILPHCFNGLLSDAYNFRKEDGTPATHFALLHADIAPEQGWLKKMLDIMRARDLAVVSCLVPIKTDSGVTSTALERMDNSWHPRRLTMREIQRLPETFTPADTMRVFGNAGLLFNSGLMLCRMDRIDPTRHAFEFRTRIIRDAAGLYRAEAQPEDWLFSRAIMRDGLQYAVTREVEVRHYGPTGWSNRRIWGEETDGQG